MACTRGARRMETATAASRRVRRPTSTVCGRRSRSLGVTRTTTCLGTRGPPGTQHSFTTTVSTTTRPGSRWTACFRTTRPAPGRRHVQEQPDLLEQPGLLPVHRRRDLRQAAAQTRVRGRRGVSQVRGPHRHRDPGGRRERESVVRNRIWNNWRYGGIQFWVPAALRGEEDRTKQYDTSHFNSWRRSIMGRSPGGDSRANGLDFWWDAEGEGNCWQGNRPGVGSPAIR
jgi:hypothetical protein